MGSRRWRAGTALVLAALMTVAVGACGSDDDEAGAEAGGGEAAGGGGDGGGLTPVRVTSIGYCNEIYLWWAQEHGIFEDHGLEVELVNSQGGAAGVAALMSGEVDFSFTNGYTALISLSQGFPLKFVSLAYESAPPGTDEVNSLIVQSDSGIESVQDLEGKRIGVNELGGINQIVTTVWLEKEGVDPEAVDFVALPIDQLPSAVANGQIDAAQVPAANVSADQSGEVTSLGDPYQEGPGVVEFAGYLTSEELFEENPETSEAFQASLTESIEQAFDPANADAAWQLAGENCNQDPEVLASQPQNTYRATIDMEVLDEMAQTLVDQGFLQEAPDISNFVPEFARHTG